MTFPYEIVDLDESLNKELMEKFHGERTGFVRVGPKGWLLPEAYRRHAEKLYTMPVREDDVWIVTFPRSGTTWCQELVWMLNNKLDYATSAKVSLDERFPFYEFNILHHEEFHKDVLAKNDNDPTVEKILSSWRIPGYESIPKLESPRHMKTHLPLSLLPQDLTKVAKVIYVARNPRDVAASYFHHNSLVCLHGYVGDFKQYWDYFDRDLDFVWHLTSEGLPEKLEGFLIKITKGEEINGFGSVAFAPYFEHVKEGWSRRNEPNVLFLFYEDLIMDLPANVRKVAAFLNKPISDEDLERLVKHLHIDNIKTALKLHDEIPLKGMVNDNFSTGFFRKGGIGGNKEYDEELLKKVEAYMDRHLTDCDIKFPIKK